MHLLFLAAVLSVKLVVQRSSLDLLDTLPIAVVLQNSAGTSQTVRFTQPVEYAIELRAPDGSVIWSSAVAPPPRQPAFPAHARTFAPGSTTLAVYDWNELLRDGTSPQAGNYTLRVRLATEKPQAENTVRVTFARPLSPSSLAALKIGEEYTLAGTLDAQRAILNDERGSATLALSLFAAPAAVPVFVRGYAVVKNGTRVFNVERWATLIAQPASAR
ncbi:MAG TPA: hypothetical protein VFE36_03010 [Candidatus Baltobacteraceae bacterium]|nr:hypothetical protein [Candidatus Baltobacteraceae bacterium]